MFQADLGEELPRCPFGRRVLSRCRTHVPSSSVLAAFRLHSRHHAAWKRGFTRRNEAVPGMISGGANLPARKK
jgi:hypothetical protein